MSSPPAQPSSGSKFLSQIDSQGSSSDSMMPSYTFFKDATNNFSEEHKVGSGKLGHVYKAHLPNGELAAVKLLYQLQTFNEKEFIYGHGQLMRAKHNNIARFFGYFYANDFRYIQFDGRTLRVQDVERVVAFELLLPWTAVYKNWRKWLQDIRKYPSFKADCKQVRTCIEIAVACTKKKPYERPLMNDIVHKLYEVQTTGHYPSSEIEWGIHEARKMSFKRLADMTSNFDEKLGHDGFGAVYKGKLEDGISVAVKRLDQRSRKSEKQFERVVSLMRLEHKNVVRLAGYCYETRKVPVPDDKNSELYVLQDVIENLFCCEFLPNGNLDRILNDKYSEFDWQTRHRIIGGICEGLHHLHVECEDAPIIHEGIKPTNILLDEGMVPKLGDFCTSLGVTPR